MDVKKPNKKIPYFFAYIVSFFDEKINISEQSLTRFRVKTLGTTRFISFDKARRIIKFKPKYNLKTTVKDMIRS